ncbi:hypothetical protein, partial [Actinoplanes sp. NBRC 103695]|uniref:hypothetical protein n=2 Tax=Actinoplanes sp. NBRC 103695 TaxID=3032202 RepID=UPI0025525597
LQELAGWLTTEASGWESAYEQLVTERSLPLPVTWNGFMRAVADLQPLTRGKVYAAVLAYDSASVELRALLPAIQVPTTGEMLRDSRTITLDPPQSQTVPPSAGGVNNDPAQPGSDTPGTDHHDPHTGQATPANADPISFAGSIKDVLRPPNPSAFLTGRRDPARAEPTPSLMDAVREVEEPSAYGEPGENAVDCAPRVEFALRAYGVPATGDDRSGIRTVDAVARLLRGSFGPTRSLDILAALTPGAVTAVWDQRPGDDAHLVLVERIDEDELVMWDPSRPSDGSRGPAFSRVALDHLSPVPDSLAGPSRFVVDGDGRLAQYHVQRNLIVFRPVEDRSDGGTVDALTDGPTRTLPTGRNDKGKGRDDRAGKGKAAGRRVTRVEVRDRRESDSGDDWKAKRRKKGHVPRTTEAREYAESLDRLSRQMRQLAQRFLGRVSEQVRVRHARSYENDPHGQTLSHVAIGLHDSGEALRLGARLGLESYSDHETQGMELNGRMFIAKNSDETVGLFRSFLDDDRDRTPAQAFESLLFTEDPNRRVATKHVDLTSEYANAVGRAEEKLQGIYQGTRRPDDIASILVDVRGIGYVDASSHEEAQGALRRRMLSSNYRNHVFFATSERFPAVHAEQKLGQLLLASGITPQEAGLIRIYGKNRPCYFCAKVLQYLREEQGYHVEYDENWGNWWDTARDSALAIFPGLRRNDWIKRQLEADVSRLSSTSHFADALPSEAAYIGDPTGLEEVWPAGDAPRHSLRTPSPSEVELDIEGLRRSVARNLVIRHVAPGAAWGNFASSSRLGPADLSPEQIEQLQADLRAGNLNQVLQDLRTYHNEDSVTIQRLARHLRMDERTVSQWVQYDKTPALKSSSTNRPRLTADEIRELRVLFANRVEGTGPAYLRMIRDLGERVSDAELAAATDPRGDITGNRIQGWRTGNSNMRQSDLSNRHRVELIDLILDGQYDRFLRRINKYLDNDASLTQIAELIGLSRSTIAKWRTAGRVQLVKGGKLFPEVMGVARERRAHYAALAAEDEQFAATEEEGAAYHSENPPAETTELPRELDAPLSVSDPWAYAPPSHAGREDGQGDEQYGPMAYRAGDEPGEQLEDAPGDGFERYGAGDFDDPEAIAQHQYARAAGIGSSTTAPPPPPPARLSRGDRRQLRTLFGTDWDAFTVRVTELRRQHPGGDVDDVIASALRGVTGEGLRQMLPHIDPWTNPGHDLEQSHEDSQRIALENEDYEPQDYSTTAPLTGTGSDYTGFVPYSQSSVSAAPNPTGGDHDHPYFDDGDPDVANWPGMSGSGGRGGGGGGFYQQQRFFPAAVEITGGGRDGSGVRQPGVDGAVAGVG